MKKIISFMVSVILIFQFTTVTTFSASVNKWQQLTPGWDNYKKGKIDQAINVFQNFINKEKNATAANYATANLGLGMCYAHSQKKLFNKALQCMNKAIQLDPSSDTAKSARDYINNDLMSSDFDLTYNLDKTITTDKAIAVIMYYMGYNGKAEKFKNIKIKDSNGYAADKWCAPYIALAVDLKSLKAVPALAQNVTRLWTAKYILNLKGINKFSYYTSNPYKDTSDLSITDQMFLNTADAQNIMKPDNSGKFYPNRLITRQELAAAIKKAVPDSFKITKINQIPPTDITTNKSKKVEVYFTNDSNDDMDKNAEFIRTHENSIDHVIFTYANIRLSNKELTDPTIPNEKDPSWKGEEHLLASDGKNYMYMIGWPQLTKMTNIAKQTLGKKFKRYISVSEDYDSGKGDYNKAFTNLESKILKDTTARAEFEKQLMAMVNKFNMDGLNIDLELVDGADMPYMTTFLTELSKTLKSQNKQLIVSLPSSMEPDDIGKTVPFDYKVVGKIADYVSVRLYGLYGPNDLANGGSGGPLAPAWWDDYVLKYVTTVIPKEKVFMGLATYGFDYDLTSKKRDDVEPVYARDFGKVAKEQAIAGTFKQKFDNDSNSPYIEYTDKQNHFHRIWFESNYSINIKINLINKYDIAGINEWSLGYEMDEFWDLMNKRIKLITK